MKYLRIIPSLLLSNGKLVKGCSFKNHKNAGSPASTVVALDSQGADEIFLLDIDSYISNKKEPDLETLKKVSKISSTPITFGGGINNHEIAKKVLRSGAEKIYLNRAVIKNKNIIKELVSHFGGQAVVIGINLTEYKNSYKIYEDKNNIINLIDYIREIQNLGIGEIKITYVDREGSKKGLDLKFSKYIHKFVRVSSIFEGGIGNLSQLEECFKNDIKAVALGSMITFSDYNIVKIKRYLFNKNYEIRL